MTGRWLSGLSARHASVKIWVRIPRLCVKTCCMADVTMPGTAAYGRWCNKQIPEACWPATLAKRVSSGRACLRTQGREWQREIASVDVWPSEAWEQTSVYTCIHKHTQTEVWCITNKCSVLCRMDYQMRYLDYSLLRFQDLILLMYFYLDCICFH